MISEPCSVQHFVRWEDDGAVTHGSHIPVQDTPFFIAGHSLMECYQGPNYRQNKNGKVIFFLNDLIKKLYSKVQFSNDYISIILLTVF